MSFKDNLKRFLIFLTSLLFIIAAMGIFSYVWYSEYLDIIELPFWQRGNWLFISLYGIFVLSFASMYGALKIGYLKLSDTIYSLFLTMVCVNIVTYIQVCLVGRNIMDITPFLYMMCADIGIILLWTGASRYIYFRLYPPQKIVIIYGDISPEDLISKLNNRRDRYNICASIHISAGMTEIRKQIRNYNTVIIWDLPAHNRNLILKYCFSHSIRCYVTPKISDIIISSADRVHLFDTPLLIARNRGLTFEQAFVKRIVDIVISSIGLIIAFPFMLIIAIAIKATDDGPIFYKQSRLTINGKKFDIYKFRSMYVDSETSGAQLAKKDDDRVTPVGRIIRNLHVDELPQLINILKGEMSFVGPRPERAVILREYQKSIPEFHYRLKVKAGLTGYAQVYGKYNTTPYDKLKLDLFYIENYSLLLDFKLILMTLRIVFQKETSEGVDSGQQNALKKKNED